MRRFIMAAVAAVAVTVAVAPAADAKTPAFEREYLAHYKQLRERHGKRAPGCNLITNRWHNRCHGKASKGDVIKSNATLERMLYVPPPAPAPVPASAAATSASTPTYSAASGGGGGTYCGLFQFDQGTWQSVGGSGSPCAASPEEQWRRAEKLQSQRGNQPWPRCGQGGASLEQIAQCESGNNPTASSG